VRNKRQIQQLQCINLAGCGRQKEIQCRLREQKRWNSTVGRFLQGPAGADGGGAGSNNGTDAQGR
jgi:hypothetical protein